MRQRAWFGSPVATLGWLTFAVLTVGAMLWTSVGSPSVARAQEDKKGDAAAADEEVPAEVPANKGKAADVAAPVPAADNGSDTGDEAKQPEEKTYLQVARQALGLWYSLVFLGLSFTLVALLVMNLLTARRENVCPATLVDGFESFLDEKQYQEAYELAKNDDSFLGQVLSAGLAKLSSGYPQAIEAMQEVGEEENMKLDHRLSYMALIGTISPMVGLFGTVQGMISSFQVIAARASTPPPAELAKGISTALFTTLVGLAIAIPAIAFYNILKNRIARLVLEVGIVSEGLMARFENVGPRKK